MDNAEHKNDDNKHSDDTDKTWKEISEYIRGSSLLEIYMNASSVVTDNEILNFKIRQICVKTGLNLLPLYNKDISEKEREEMQDFYNLAKEKIQNYFPKARRALYSYRNLGEKNAEVYKITSDEDGAHDYDSRPEDVYELIKDYRRNQFELYSMKLDDFDNTIRQYLSKYYILPHSSPEIELDKQRTKMYQELDD